MTNGELYAANRNRWALQCPRAACALDRLKTRCLSMCTTGPQEQNIRTEEDGAVVFFHSSEGALQEASAWFQKLDLYRIGTLFVYGVGLGYAYLAAKQWLKEDSSRFLVFLEQNLEGIDLLLRTQIGADLLADEQVYLAYCNTDAKEGEIESRLENIPHFYFISDFRLAALPYYSKKYPKAYGLLELQLNMIKNSNALHLLEYMTFSRGFFANFYRNLFSLPEGCLAHGLFRKFEGVPAIICGAGPSLSKHIDQLKNLGNQALILAGGSALNILNFHGIAPHFGVSIDPNWNQYARLFMNQSYEVPFFYRNRIYPEALSLFQGNHVYVAGSGGYQVAAFFENELGICPDAIPDEGLNVVNFSVAIAQALGCNPIVLTGVDLAYTEGQSYPPGILPHPILDSNQEIRTKGSQEEIISKLDIFGKPVMTLWKWVQEALWIGDFSSKNPSLVLLNATEGGIGFPGVPNLSLKQAVSNFLSREWDLPAWIHAEMQNAAMPPSVCREKIQETLVKFEHNLVECQSLCHEIAEECGRLALEGNAEKLSDFVQSRIRTLEIHTGYAHLLCNYANAYRHYYGDKRDRFEIDFKQSKIDPQAIYRDGFEWYRNQYRFLESVCKMNAYYLKNALDADRILQRIYEVFSEKNPIFQIQEVEAGPEPVYEVAEGGWMIEDPELGISFRDALPAAPADNLKDTEAEGYMRAYYPSGTLKTEQYYKNGTLHGPSSSFSPSGQLLARSWFIQGKKTGRSAAFYADGSVYSREIYADGKLHGRQRYFYPEGRLKAVIDYDQGLLHGEVLLYYPHGLKKRELHFQQGKRHGVEIFWNRGGIKEFEGVYRHDRPAGVFRSWYALGNIAREATYDEAGTLISNKGWSREGQPLAEGQLSGLDYFHLISKETRTLTHSFEQMYENVARMVEGYDQVKSERAGRSPEMLDLTEDLEELKNELENLKAINLELHDQYGSIAEHHIEALWKTPATQKELGKQIESESHKMIKDIQALEETMRLMSRLLGGPGSAQDRSSLKPPDVHGSGKPLSS